MDALTTLLFLSKGVDEGNPLVNWTFSYVRVPWAALVFTKLVAALIGWHCHRTGRKTLLRRANAAYLVVVGWNLLAVAAAVAATR